jgi:acyl carrier protein
MTRPQFLRLLEVQMEIPEGSLDEDQRLADVDSWDSLAALLFIALADEKLGITVVGNDIANSKTISDLLALLGDRLAA